MFKLQSYVQNPNVIAQLDLLEVSGVFTSALLEEYTSFNIFNTNFFDQAIALGQKGFNLYQSTAFKRRGSFITQEGPIF